jgi:2-dehydro-3-deoxyphosphogluconate aldolase/(4S)-4-hydroxy-2-oxoglutarate aldolase
MTMQEICAEHKICAILRNVPDEIVLDYAKACAAGGVRMFEVAMNTPTAPQQIRLLNDYFGDAALAGAGTVISPARIEAAAAAGARFFLTPSASICTLEYCRRTGMPLLPGVMTPTDVALCLEYGFPVLKLFPASELPMHYIRSLQGPFSETSYVAVGGVGPDNIRRFFENGFIGVGIGSNLIPKAVLAARDWNAAAQQIEAMVRSVAAF